MRVNDRLVPSGAHSSWAWRHDRARQGPYPRRVRTDDAGLAWEILQRYDDPATAAFDAVLADAGVSDEVARSLRFWQRESVANVKQFAAEALPAVLHVIATAQHDADEATARARDALPPGTMPWAGHVVVTLPERAPQDLESHERLEERRRTVAARLAQLG